MDISGSYSGGYKCREKYTTPAGTITVLYSSGGEDAQWDNFLEKTSTGRHEQSSLWGLVKSLSGWQSFRYVLKLNENIVGGFQTLWRRQAPFGTISYITKGPVISLNDLVLRDIVVAKIQDSARDHRLNYVLVQPACIDDNLTGSMVRRAFLPYFRKDVIRTTCDIDLSRDEMDILRSMRRYRRKGIKKGLQSNISIREGDVIDLGIFFELMLQTCKRRGVRPNPASLEILKTIWQLYHPRGWLRLFFATYEGEYITGSLIVTFGDRAFFWKAGWSGRHKALRPNDVLDWSCIKWAKEKGYRFVDFCGINRSVAKAIEQTKPLPSKLHNTPTFYKLGFGVRQVPLPDPKIYIRNRLTRITYNLLCLIKKGQANKNKTNLSLYTFN